MVEECLPTLSPYTHVFAILGIFDLDGWSLPEDVSEGRKHLLKTLSNLWRAKSRVCISTEDFYSFRLNWKSKFLCIRPVCCLSPKVEWISVALFGLKGTAFKALVGMKVEQGPLAAADQLFENDIYWPAQPVSSITWRLKEQEDIVLAECSWPSRKLCCDMGFYAASFLTVPSYVHKPKFATADISPG